MAIISIWDKENKLVGHIGKLSFETKCHDDEIEVTYCQLVAGGRKNSVCNMAEASFIEIMDSLEDEKEYRIICQATEIGESSYVINRAIFYEWPRAFKPGKLFIYEAGLLAFEEKLPRHSFMDVCLEEEGKR